MRPAVRQDRRCVGATCRISKHYAGGCACYDGLEAAALRRLEREDNAEIARTRAVVDGEPRKARKGTKTPTGQGSLF